MKQSKTLHSSSPLLRSSRSLVLTALATALGVSCSETSSTPPAVNVDAGSDAAPVNPYPYAGVEQKESFTAPGLSGPVDVVRDEMGIPHISAATASDAGYAQGYFMARDRWVQMDFARRQAAGTLSEVVGGLNPLAVLSDFNYRTHRMRETAEATLTALEASQDPTDQEIVRVLKSFSAGINAWQADLLAGKYALGSEYAILYTTASVTPWSPVDSLLLGELQAFNLAFDAEAEIQRTKIAVAEQAQFVGSADAEKVKRVGFAEDYNRFAPFDATYTVSGWGEATASLWNPLKPGSRLGTKAKKNAQRNEVALLDRGARGTHGVGLDRVNEPSRGSNNWVLGPSLSATGHALVANDTHLALSNPAIFYLNHITTADGLDVMGVQFPGIPLVTLGMNQKVAWGGTVSNLDVTDVYQEQVVDCASGGGKCVVFKGAEVKLIERQEAFKIGGQGKVIETKTYTYYTVPHHGPIVPNVVDGAIVGLQAKELSIKYTGYEPGRLLRAVYELNRATSVEEGVKAIDTHFTHGGQNWVLGDTQGNIAWTQGVRVPKRPKGTKPWLVMPGDGSAEWAGYWPTSALPHAKNPSKGYLVTANADPIGTTDDNNPMNEPEVDGYPKYLGSDFDPGMRAGRITKRVIEATTGKKATLDDMASIQADAISETGRFVAPLMIAAAKALSDEAKTPGTHPELAPMLASMTPEARAFLQPMQDLLAGWSFDTPAAVAEEAPSAAQIADSKATLMAAVWTGAFARAVVSDELGALSGQLYPFQTLKLVTQMVRDPSKLRTGSAIFDDLNTPAIETRDFMAARSVVETLTYLFTDVNADPAQWRWGTVHTVTPKFFAAVGLDLPTAARHGGDGTVDVAAHGIAGNTFTFGAGPTIRFVAEMDPEKGPIARNAIPGGEIFDPQSPHYADFYALWRKNQAASLAFQSADVVARATQELAKNGIGRTRFAP